MASRVRVSSPSLSSKSSYRQRFIGEELEYVSRGSRVDSQRYRHAERSPTSKTPAYCSMVQPYTYVGRSPYWLSEAKSIPRAFIIHISSLYQGRPSRTSRVICCCLAAWQGVLRTRTLESRAKAIHPIPISTGIVALTHRNGITWSRGLGSVV